MMMWKEIQSVRFQIEAINLILKKKTKKKTNIENHSYTGGNRTPTGRSLKGPQNI